jgi:hypothetical protein
MANVLATLFSDIATAIRNKTGTTNKMSPKDFPIYINNIVVNGGDGDTTTGWVTLIEEQTITAEYNEYDECYEAQNIPIIDQSPYNLYQGAVYRVFLDGVRYYVGMGSYPIKINLGDTINHNTAFGAGDISLRKLLGLWVGTPPEYKGYEPFMIMGKPDKNPTHTDLYFKEGETHTIKVEYMPRYIAP